MHPPQRLRVVRFAHMELHTFASFCNGFSRAALAVGAGCLLGFTVVGSVKSLEAALIKQCASQDWPAHQHDAHVEYCIATVGIDPGLRINKEALK